jgi:hypothetical protein
VDETGFLKKGAEVLRRRAPIHWHRGNHRELPSRRLPGLRCAGRCRVHRPRPVSATGMDRRSGAPDRGECS